MLRGGAGRHNCVMEQRKAYRVLTGRKVAGVAQGLARHLGVEVKYVRIGFVAATIVGSGAGLLAYLAFWALLPMDPDEAVAAQDREPQADPGWIILIAVLSAAALLALVALGFASFTSYLWPVVLGAIGIATVWMRADELQRARWRADAAGVARDAATDAAAYGRGRLILGSAAVLLAVIGFSLSSVGVATMLQGLATTLLLLLGLGLVAFPWLHEQWQSLSDERAAHIRADERAEMAARIHDSVLQTLTLVQKHADDPMRIQQLARSEERALRDWLYGDETSDESFSAALHLAAQEVETRHGVTIDVVAVGDAQVDSRIEAVLAAAQEAMVNAAKHSGVAAVQVYAEVEPEHIAVYVRDRGAGFEPANVPSDRAGVRESIEGRMKRSGGTATIRSRTGEGTEVALELPRSES